MLNQPNTTEPPAADTRIGDNVSSVPRSRSRLRLSCTAVAASIVISACGSSGRHIARPDAADAGTAVPDTGDPRVEPPDEGLRHDLDPSLAVVVVGTKRGKAASTEVPTDSDDLGPYVAAPVAAIGAQRVDTEIPASSAPPAARTTVLRGPIDDIFLVGDSLYFDPGKIHDEIPIEFTNRIVDFISEHLIARYQAFSTARFTNISLPGVSIDQALGDRDKTTRSVLADKVLALPADQRPDLVIYTVSRIDINRDDISMELLIPLLVERISRDVLDLEQAGVQTVIVPALPVDDDLYRRITGNANQKHLNARVEMLNTAIAAADLPLLSIRFTGLDTDGKPGPDDVFYRDYMIPEFAAYGITTDGIHLAESGQRAAAADIAEGFANVVVEG